jgi:hypothetical protein
LDPIMPNVRPYLPLLLLPLAAALAPAALAQEDHAVRPGYWDYTTSTILPGSSDGKRCVRPDQIEEFMSGPHNRHYRCTYPISRVGDGRALFDGECVNKHDEHYKISVAGTYAPTHFNLKGHIQGKLLGLPLSSPISIDARWLGAECPAGAP